MKDNNGNNEKELLYNFISSEIDNINKENRKPGWTKWAILVSMATLFWLLFGLLEAANFCLKNIALYIIIFCFIYDFFSLIGNLLSPQLETKNRFFYTNEDLTSTRFSLLINIIKYLMLIILINNFVFVLNLTLLKVTFFINLILTCIVFLLTFIKIPLYLKKKKSQYLLLIYLFYYLFIVYKVLVFFSKNLSLISIIDLKISLTLCAIFYLIYLLSKSWSNKSIRSQLLLIGLRKDLVLKDTNLKEIKERLDVILDGLKVSAIFQGYTDKYLIISEEINQISDETEQIVYELDKLLSAKGKNISDQEKDLAERYIITINEQIDKADILNKKLGKILNRFILITTYFKAIINQDDVDEILQLFNKINIMSKKTTVKTKNVGSKIKDIMSRLKSKKD
ncbi:hypothetical protein D4R71_04875 [bacterium]|nr:MAG: hypothetical protein D4R71_04875 [bacterium]